MSDQPERRKVQHLKTLQLAASLQRFGHSAEGGVPSCFPVSGAESRSYGFRVAHSKQQIGDYTDTRLLPLDCLACSKSSIAASVSATMMSSTTVRHHRRTTMTNLLLSRVLPRRQQLQVSLSCCPTETTADHSIVASASLVVLVVARDELPVGPVERWHFVLVGSAQSQSSLVACRGG